MLTQEMYLKYKYAKDVERKRNMSIMQTGNMKEAMSILKSEKVNFNTESISRDIEVQFYNNEMVIS